jgi:hypothetical protein
LRVRNACSTSTSCLYPPPPRPRGWGVTSDGVKSLLLSPLSTFSPKVPGNGQDIK